MLNRLIVLALLACFSACAIPIGGTRYPIDVFFGEDLPNKPFDEIKNIQVSQRLKTEGGLPTENGRFNNVGLDQRGKELLLGQLVAKAIQAEADGLIGVSYTFETSRDSTAYKIEGVVIRYK